MGKTSSSQHRRLQSAVVRPLPALEAAHPHRNSAHAVQSLWRLGSLEKKPIRLSDTQRRRLRRKRAKERDNAREMGALQALDNATRTLVLNNLKAPRGRPADQAVPELRWTSISRSGDPSGGAAPSGGCLPVCDTRQRSSSRAERFKQFSSK